MKAYVHLSVIFFWTSELIRNQTNKKLIARPSAKVGFLIYILTTGCPKTYAPMFKPIPTTWIGVWFQTNNYQFFRTYRTISNFYITMWICLIIYTFILCTACRIIFGQVLIISRLCNFLPVKAALGNL